MRVVHLCNVPLPPDHPDSGRIPHHPGRWVLNLALAQRAHAGIDARVVMQVPGSRQDYHTKMEGVPVHFVAAPDKFRSATLFVPDALRLRRAVLAQMPDLVHAHGTEDAYALAAEACRLPSVITAQGCFFLINRELPPRPISRARVVQFTEWIAFKRATHVIAKSAYVRDELRRAFPHLVLHEIPNTIDPSLLEIPTDRDREQGSLAFVGTLVPRKGVDFIVQALGFLKARNPDFYARLTLHVFGDRPASASDYERDCKRQLVSLLGKRVFFHGTIPALQVAEALSRIKVLLAPSVEEMFGNQFIEAMAVGADAIVTEGTAMAENAKRLQAGRIIPLRDSEALAEKIIEAVDAETSPEVLRERQRRCLNFAGPETVARRHLDVYQKIVSRS